MKKAKDLIGIVLLNYFVGCSSPLQINPVAPLPIPENPCSSDPSGKYSAICDSDRNQNGMREQAFYDHDGRLVKEIEGGMVREFIYGPHGNLEKYVIFEEGRTEVHEFKEGRLRRDMYDSDSDHNFEDIFEYDGEGNATRYLFDQNDDGFPDLVSYSTDDRTTRIELDLDFNGRFDTFIEYVLDHGRVAEEWKNIDKVPEDGKIDIIYGTFYDDKGRIVKVTSDYDGDGIPENIWYPD